MTIDEANKALDGICVKNMGTIYCKAEKDSYGKPLVVHLEGGFTPDDIRQIADIAKAIEL